MYHVNKHVYECQQIGFIKIVVIITPMYNPQEDYNSKHSYEL